jgi:hypothetical protein
MKRVLNHLMSEKVGQKHKEEISVVERTVAICIASIGIFPDTKEGNGPEKTPSSRNDSS